MEINITQSDVINAHQIGIAEENKRITQALFQAIGIPELFRGKAAHDVTITADKWDEFTEKLFDF